MHDIRADDIGRAQRLISRFVGYTNWAEVEILNMTQLALHWQNCADTEIARRRAEEDRLRRERNEAREEAGQLRLRIAEQEALANRLELERNEAQNEVIQLRHMVDQFQQAVNRQQLATLEAAWETEDEDLM
jgi:hypothetical protein